MAHPIIKVSNVSKSFHVGTQDVLVLKKISFEVKEKDFLIIFGPSGCGKSTLLHLMLGLEEPTSGSVTLLGKDIWRGTNEDERSDFRKNHVGMIYQQPNWIRSLSVIENVAFPLLLLGQKKTDSLEKAKKILQIIGMAEWANYIPTELSSGQQQKVSLARALITNPELIIADEPTGNLDFESGQELMELLVNLNMKHNKTIVMVTHDLEYLKYSENAIRMFNGEIVDNYGSGDKTRLYSELKGKRTVDLKIALSQKSQKIGDMFDQFYNRIVNGIERHKSSSISRQNLIDLSLRYLKVKRARTMVTVGGMMIGIGAIVFLVSVGYGLQQLVVNRVVRLEEMRQADISPQSGGKVKIDDKALADFKDINSVEMVLPLIAAVGRVSYQNSVSDMAVYGVTTDYLKESAIKPIYGKVFESNKLTFDVTNLDITEHGSQVAGIATEGRIGTMAGEIQKVDYSIEPEMWIRVRQGPSISDEILGYTRRVEGKGNGIEVWGSTYESDDDSGDCGEDETGKRLGKWVKADLLLWKEEECDQATQGDCEEGKYLVYRDDENRQVQKTGYFAEIGIELTGADIGGPHVLGESTTNDVEAEIGELEWVDIASESGETQTQQTKVVDIGSGALKQAVVNRAMLKVLGIKEKEAVGKKFDTSFVVVGDLLPDPTEGLESAKIEYAIVGVTPDDKTPVIYVPFTDLRSLGITNYSQVKMVVKNQDLLSKVRKQVESMGYITRSVADTVTQINSLFATGRALLALLGMVALTVAALGMFNTLTVSLLERTREVGLMKAMGMKSSEVRELFLTESMIMGFFGGILGIVLGFVLGKLLGAVLSLFAIFKGVGLIDISYIPFSFFLTIILLSLLVGVMTGIYPSKRATKISALNALRYE